MIGVPMTDSFEELLKRGLADTPLISAEDIMRRGRSMQRRERLRNFTVGAAVVAIAGAAVGVIATQAKDRERRLEGIVARPPDTSSTSPDAIGDGPNRGALDWNNREDRANARAPIINGFRNVPDYGDERTFVDARTTRDENVAHGDPVRIKTGDEVWIRIYVRNGAAPNSGEQGTARGVRVGVGLSNRVARDHVITAHIAGTNVDSVYDTVALVSDDGEVGLEMVPGSAYLSESGRGGSTRLSDTVVDPDGVILPNRGLLPPTDDSGLRLTVKLRVSKPALEVTHRAFRSMPRPGEIVPHELVVENVGSIVAEDVVIAITLGKAEELMHNSVSVKYPLRPKGQQLRDSVITKPATINYGLLAPGQRIAITYRTRATGTCGDRVSNVARVWSIGVSPSKTAASLMITCR